MDKPWVEIEGQDEARVLIVADHASNRVPEGINLGIDPALLSTHIAIDLGVAPLAASLCARLNCAAIMGNVSRLVIDFNREEGASGLIPLRSDGHLIPGNAMAHREARLDDFYRPYHDHLGACIAAQRPGLLVSLHSFTPSLVSRPEEQRPWQVGILYNADDRAARIALPLLSAQQLCVGDQQPYSGKDLNATMNRHGEANSIPYLGLEVRQDEISNANGVAYWANLLAPIIHACEVHLRVTAQG